MWSLALLSPTRTRPADAIEPTCGHNLFRGRRCNPRESVGATCLRASRVACKAAPGDVAVESTSSPDLGVADPGSHLHFLDNSPSWEELQQAVASKQRALNALPADPEAGPPTSQSQRRTFGQPGEPRLKLYRDHAAWCPYCQKIVLQLEEKRIPYTVEKLPMTAYGPDKPADFLSKVPTGLVPVLEVDGGPPIVESAVIAQEIEKLFPDSSPLLPPAGAPERERADKLLQRDNEVVAAAFKWLRSTEADAGTAKEAFIAALDSLEAELAATPGPYFLQDFSLVDISFAPFLERVLAFVAYYRGFLVRGQGRWPNLERWFEAMEGRPAYLAFKSDWYTLAHSIQAVLQGLELPPEAEQVVATVDGKDGSWHLPLPPLSAASLEPYSPGERPELDRLEAAATLVGNHAAVVRFALRAVGEPGPKPVGAPLSDPTAIPGLQWEQEVDAALRHAAHALLEGVESKQVSTQHSLRVGTSPSLADGQEGLAADAVVACLHYLRDRVGVPRDMSFPAARQFRAHLTWVADALAGQ